jgi:hypothetical protein
VRPTSINHLIRNWYANKRTTRRKRLLIRVAAMFWAIWLCNNDMVFSSKSIPSTMQVLLGGGHIGSGSEDYCRKKITMRSLRCAGY